MKKLENTSASMTKPMVRKSSLSDKLKGRCLSAGCDPELSTPPVWSMTLPRIRFVSICFFSWKLNGHRGPIEEKNRRRADFPILMAPRWLFSAEKAGVAPRCVDEVPAVPYKPPSIGKARPVRPACCACGQRAFSHFCQPCLCPCDPRSQAGGRLDERGRPVRARHP